VNNIADWQVISDLYETILARKMQGGKDSYTASLFASGTGKIAQKVGEEAVETIIAAMQQDSEELAKESADLIYHLLVLWADRGLAPADVLTILNERKGQSGLEEKHNRKA
jgi:phosphoribosyl-ATP pyrophosphohydrolase